MQHARRWAAEVCRALDRADLVEAAELGVSELVTNALLHAQPPITLRVRGTRAHPRIEVADGSRQPPQMRAASFDFDDLGDLDAVNDLDADSPDLDAMLETVGRGLSMLAMSSRAWGAEIVPEGKVVWFEPTADPRSTPADGQVFEASDVGSDPEQGLRGERVHLTDVPLPLYQEFRRHFRELRREVRLLALMHESDYPLASELSVLFDAFEQQIDGIGSNAAAERALAAGRRRLDLDLVAGDELVRQIPQMIDLLDLADAFCRTQRLLALARSDEQRDFQQWYLSEIARQARGEGPVRWSSRERADDSYAS